MPPVRITVEVDAAQAQRVLQAVERSMTGVGDAAQRASQRGAGGWRQTVQDVRDIGLAAWTTMHTVRRMADAIGDTVQRGIDVGRVSNLFDVMAGGSDAAEIALNDMRQAVKGTISDFELMQLGSEALSIGLVDNAGDLGKFAEAARVLSLTSRAGASATSELVLAMSNMTTRRFDQLGLSIMKFKDNLEAVKKEASALSDEEAWREAFWRTVEDRVDEVGGALNAAGSDVEQLNAKMANLGDRISQGLVPIFDEAAGVITGFFDVIDAGAAAHEDTVSRLVKDYDDYLEFVEAFKSLRGVELSLFAQVPSLEEYQQMRAQLNVEVADEKYLDWKRENIDEPLERGIGIVAEKMQSWEDLEAELAAWGADGVSINAFISQERGELLRTYLQNVAGILEITPDFVDNAAAIVGNLLDAMEPEKPVKADVAVKETARDDVDTALDAMEGLGITVDEMMVGPGGWTTLYRDLEARAAGPDAPKVKVTPTLGEGAFAVVQNEVKLHFTGTPPPEMPIVPKLVSDTAQRLAEELVQYSRTPLEIEALLKLGTDVDNDALDAFEASLHAQLRTRGLNEVVIRAIFDNKQLPDIQETLATYGMDEAEITAVIEQLGLPNNATDMAQVLLANGWDEVAVAAFLEFEEKQDLKTLMAEAGIDDEVLIEAILASGSAESIQPLIEKLIEAKGEADRVTQAIDGINAAVGLLGLTATEREILELFTEGLPEDVQQYLRVVQGAENVGTIAVREGAGRARELFEQGAIAQTDYGVLMQTFTNLLQNAPQTPQATSDAVARMMGALEAGVDVTAILGAVPAQEQTAEQIAAWFWNYGPGRDLIGVPEKIVQGAPPIERPGPTDFPEYFLAGMTPGEDRLPQYAGGGLHLPVDYTLEDLDQARDIVSGVFLPEQTGIDETQTAVSEVDEILGGWAGMLSPEALALIDTKEEAQAVVDMLRGGENVLASDVIGLDTALIDAAAVVSTLSAPIAMLISAKLSVEAIPADELAALLAPAMVPYLQSALGDIGQRNAPSGPATYGTRGSGTGAARPAA